MDLVAAMINRRSVRKYTSREVEKETIEYLFQSAIQASSASNSQPWAFAVIQDSELLKQYSERAKKHLINPANLPESLAKYRNMLADPNFNIFYNAGTLIIIYAKPKGPHPYGDCCLAAQNLMLAAHARGLGTCWIGFAHAFLDLPELKRDLGVPSEYTAVAPIIVGYPVGKLSQLPRKNPEIIFWLHSRKTCTV